MKAKPFYMQCRTAVSIALIAVVVCGCANLSAIRDFAEISASTAEHTRLTEEYVQWPQTQKRYQPESEHGRLDGMARQRALQEKTLLLRHALIVEYMGALGRLAADEAVLYDKEVDSLGRALKEAKFADQKEADAFGAVAKLILKATTDAWRQARLKEFVKTANPDIQLIIGGLRQIIDRGFMGDLDDEDAAVRKYYQTIIRQSDDKAGITALIEWREAKLVSIADRRSAMEAYSRSLSKIAEAHQKLNDTIVVSNLKSREFLGQMSRYAKDIRTAYNAVTSL